MTIYEINPRFIIVTNGERPTSGYPTNSILYDTTTKIFYQWNGTTWDSIGNNITSLDDIPGVDLTTDPPDNNDVLTYSSSGTKWVPAPPPGAGGGEANTLGSVGTGEGTLPGTKTGTTLNVKSLKQGTNVTLTNNTNDVTITSAYPPDATDAVKGIVELSLSNGSESAGGRAVQDNDTRLTNARTPTTHQHPFSDINTGQLAYSYIIYKSGSNYIAFNTITKTEQFSNTTAHTTFNSVIDAMNTAGGGQAYVKNALYLFTSSIIPKDNCELIGEDREKTILRHTVNTASTELFRYWQGASSALLTNFKVKHMKWEIHNANGNSTGETEKAWISSGTKNIVFEDVWMKSFSTPSVSKISVFLDTAGNTNNNEYPKVQNCIFEGSANAQDTFGTGKVYKGDFSNNRFYNLTSQAFGINECYDSNFSENVFENTGNAIGFEGNLCEGNIIVNNILRNTRGIKLSGFNTTTNFSRSNIVKGNLIEYGQGGIENGNGRFDVIEGNIIRRTERNGIYGTMYGAKINDNIFEDTNFTNGSTTVNSVSHKDGGILLVNNTSVMADSDFNNIENNTFIDTGTTFTDPVSGLTKNGDNGAIVIDTNYDRTLIKNNRFTGLQNGTVFDYGTETINYGIIPDAYEDAKVSELVSELFVGANTSYGSGVFAFSYDPVQGTTGYDFGATFPSRHYTTGAVAGNKAGRTLYADTRRNMLPRIFSKFALAATADHALFIGWATGFTYDAVHATTPLNAMMGIGLAVTTDKTNFQIIHNDATGACTYIDSGKSKDTDFHTIEIWTDNTNWYYNFDKGFKRGIISTDIPDATTLMYLHWTNLTNTTATKKFNVAKLLCKIKG